MEFSGTVITLSIGTDRPLQTVYIDPDQMPQKAASDQGQHGLPYIQQYFRQIKRW